MLREENERSDPMTEKTKVYLIIRAAEYDEHLKLERSK